MSNPMNDLHSIGLNPFAVTLLAESMLKSAYVKHCGTKPLTFEFPVRRGDCEGWVGVRITIEAVPVPHGVQALAVPASGPLRDLGAYLARVLDEDQWAHAEALLLKATDGVSVPGDQTIQGKAPIDHG